MGQKVIIRFWWESGLLSASRNQLTTFCRPFAHYACLRLCTAIIHLSKTIAFILSAMADQRKLRQNFGLGNMNTTSIKTSQTMDIKYKWHHAPLNEPPSKFSAYATGCCTQKVTIKGCHRYSILAVTVHSYLHEVHERNLQLQGNGVNLSKAKSAIFTFLSKFKILFKWNRALHELQQFPTSKWVNFLN